MSRSGVVHKVRLLGRAAQRPSWLLSYEGPTREQTLEAIHQHIQKTSKGPRRGWQAKAAAWVKKVHVSRGDVPVGTLKSGRFVIDQRLRPHYIVPDLTNTQLKPYVLQYDPAEVQQKLQQEAAVKAQLAKV